MANLDELKIKARGFLSLPILRDVFIILFIAIFGWKLINTTFALDFSNFDFNKLSTLY